MYIDLFQTSFLFFVIIILTLDHLPTSFCIDDEKYVACTGRFKCANIPNLGYPFWGDGRPEYCGHPGFELNCQAHVPLISIQSRLHRVLQIDDGALFIKVAREDLWNNTCPELIYDTELDYSLFRHPSRDQNLTLYYGCARVQHQPVPLPLPNKFDCTVNGTNSDCYFVSRQASLVPNPNLATCSHNIIVPIDETAAQSLTPTPTTLPTVSDLRAILANGFGLLWDANDSDCNECTRSGGRCGYNSSSASFACYCADRPYLHVCAENGVSSSSNAKTLDIVLPVVGAIIAGICFGWLIFFCRQWRRKKFVLPAQYTSQPESKHLPTPTRESALIITPSVRLSKTVSSYPYSISELERGSTYFGVQIFSYSHLQEATNNFSPSRVLGDGGSGTVYYGTLNDGRVVAVKRLFENNSKRLEQFMNEVEILARLQHENLVKLYGCTSRQSQGLLLVYEYIQNGTLADHLHGKLATSGLVSWSARLNIAIETAKALAYLHSSDIVHRDVKSNNILLDSHFHVKVADFGLSRLFPTDASHVSTGPQGTLGYVDPEYFRTFKLTEKSDVYSFGVVLIELISSLQVMDARRRHRNINLAYMAVDKIQNNRVIELLDKSLGFEEDTSIERMATMVGELGFRCLQEDKEMRPSMQEVVEILKGIKYVDFDGKKEQVLGILVDDSAPLKGMDF